MVLPTSFYRKANRSMSRNFSAAGSAPELGPPCRAWWKVTIRDANSKGFRNSEEPTALCVHEQGQGPWASLWEKMKLRARTQTQGNQATGEGGFKGSGIRSTRTFHLSSSEYITALSTLSFQFIPTLPCTTFNLALLGMITQCTLGKTYRDPSHMGLCGDRKDTGIRWGMWSQGLWRQPCAQRELQR